ncbi:MAG: ATP-dependent DNA helicase [Clostridia bacterium]|nr:ATP-dependent DNA helicase [Clostridia bacterium]
MEYRKSDDTIMLTVTELASYARSVERPARTTEKYGFRLVWEADDPADEIPGDIRPETDPAADGNRLHNQLETDRVNDGGETLDAGAEVELAWLCETDGQRIELHGRSDSIAFDGQIHTVEEIKTVASFRDDPTPLTVPSHFAQAVCYAFMLCQTSQVNSAAVAITFVRRSDGARRTWRAVFSLAMLSSFVSGLLRRAMPFLQIEKERATFRLDELSNLPFPYPTVREGQKDFVTEAARTIRHGGRLFVSAPCGIGKTISSLYPALRAVGSGRCDRIFYATAKTITGKAALDAAERISRYAPHMRAILLLAKENLCASLEIEGETVMALKCPICPSLHGMSGAFRTSGNTREWQSWEERQSEALLSLLENGRIYTPEKIRETAAAYDICPHELALGLSEYCDLVICDYNYLFDDRMRLRRYFKDIKRKEKYVFLIDEAHNLPDRARAMYSASLAYQDIRKLRDIKDRLFAEDADLEAVLVPVENWFRRMGKLCEKESYLVNDGSGEKKIGHWKSSQLPDLHKRFEPLTRHLSKQIRSRHEFAGELVPFRQLLQSFISAAEYADERFCFFAESEMPAEVSPGTERDVTVQILCLDPGGVLDTMLKSARASIFFSATLSPAEYYQSVTGSEHGTYLDLPSPYEKDNLCLVAYDGISTRYSDRKGTAEDTAEIIARAVEAKEGHYIVYFPSYAYMKSVYKWFRRLCPHIPAIQQKSGMGYGDREKFLAAFESGKYPHLVGFCVLGGMFSEGIDLRGKSLIGAVIVGTGLPGLSAQLNLVADYYQNKSENGREFAYIYPGMNKVLQAAGRVIRSETDRGVVLLIDDRYNEPGTKLLFPAHWQHIRYTADPDSLERILARFWKEKTDGTTKGGTI